MRKRVLTARNLALTYGSGIKTLRALNGVSMVLGEGEALGIVGESGSGKTTLGKILAGLLPPSAGAVYYNGKLMNGRPRREIQMVFQDSRASLNPRMTVGSLVEEGLILGSRVGREEREKRVLETLCSVGLAGDALGRYPYQFSGGQRQRIALARAMVVKPKILILDEPVSSLDVTVGAQIIGLLSGMKEHFGLAYILISHNLAVVRQLCERVVVMYLGKIVETGPIDSVYTNPAHAYTKLLLQSHLSPDPRAKRMLPPAGEPPDPFRPPSGCPFHPRCGEMLPVCRKDIPALRETGPGHSAACHFQGR